VSRILVVDDDPDSLEARVATLLES